MEEIGLLNLYRMDCENEKNIAKYIRLKVKIQCGIFGIGVKCKIKSIPPDVTRKMGEFKHEVRQFQKPYDNQQVEQISLMV